MGRNVAWLLGGRGFDGVLGLVYLGIAARTLGPDRFGAFSLVLAYGQAIANLIQFQSWQAVIRYGALHQATGRHDRMARLLGFTTALDLASAVVGAAVAAAGIIVVAPWLGWSPDEMRRAALFSAALLLSIGGTPSGVLRLFDRFDILTYCQATGPLVRLAGSLIVWASGGGVAAFLAVWAAAALIQSAISWVAALSPAAARPAGRWPALRRAIGENQGIGRFMWHTNLSSSLSLVGEQIGTLAVGAVAGAATAGGFRLASRLARALSKPVQAVARAIYPELARLVASDDRPTLAKVVHRVQWGAAAVGLLVLLVAWALGPQLLRLLAGDGYRFAEPLLILCAVAGTIEVSGFALEPLLTAHGLAGHVLAIRLLGTSCHLLALACLVPTAGPYGAAVAAVISVVVVRIALQRQVGAYLRH